MTSKKTPSFVLELPLVVGADQAKRLCAHLEAARYSAFLLAYLDPAETIPSIALKDWEGAEPRLTAVMECL